MHHREAQAHLWICLVFAERSRVKREFSQNRRNGRRGPNQEIFRLRFAQTLGGGTIARETYHGSRAKMFYFV